LLPSAQIVTLPGLGHLAHEEQPQRIAELVLQCAELTAINEIT
jgi:magnesium chelatase accessory protein